MSSFGPPNPDNTEDNDFQVDDFKSPTISDLNKAISDDFYLLSDSVGSLPPETPRPEFFALINQIKDGLKEESKEIMGIIEIFIKNLYPEMSSDEIVEVLSNTQLLKKAVLESGLSLSDIQVRLYVKILKRSFFPIIILFKIFGDNEF